MCSVMSKVTLTAGVAAGGGDVPQSGADCEPDEEEDAS